MDSDKIYSKEILYELVKNDKDVYKKYEQTFANYSVWVGVKLYQDELRYKHGYEKFDSLEDDEIYKMLLDKLLKENYLFINDDGAVGCHFEQSDFFQTVYKIVYDALIGLSGGIIPRITGSDITFYFKPLKTKKERIFTLKNKATMKKQASSRKNTFIVEFQTSDDILGISNELKECCNKFLQKKLEK